MKSRLLLALAAVLAFGAFSQAQSAAKNGPSSGSARERLIGAWRLVSLRERAADGKVASIPGLKGTLIYTRDGYMSVQVMYPQSDSALSNAYVLNGYEAEYGRYNIDERAHTFTFHVEGALVRALIGKDLPRAYEFSGKLLIVKSTRPDEHWEVAWERY